MRVKEKYRYTRGMIVLKGVYCLLISVPSKQVVNKTALGELVFKRGYWVYIGSAQGTSSTNLSNRLERHFRQEKKIHWHIDHLLATNVDLIDAVWAESPPKMECKVAHQLEMKPLFLWGPKGFGSSDCTESCWSHILFYQGTSQPIDLIISVFQSLNLNPQRYSKNKPLTR